MDGLRKKFGNRRVWTLPKSSEHVLDTHQQTLFWETHPVQRHGTGFKKGVSGEGAMKCVPRLSCSLYGHPRKAWAKPSLASSPQTNLGLPFPIWWQLRARHTGNAACLGLPGKGRRMQREGSHQPLGRQHAGLSPSCPSPPLPVSAGSPV